MSDDAPTAVETAEAASDTVADAVAETVDAVVAPVEAVAEAAVAPVVKAAKVAALKPSAKPAPVKKPLAKTAPKPAVAKPAPVVAKRASKPAIAAPAAPVVEAVRKVNRKAATAVAKRKYVRKAAAAVAPVAAVVTQSPTASPFNAKLLNQGMKIMDTTNWFAGFSSVPGADKFQSMFADVGEKSQEVVRKGQAFAETLSETAKANMEAVVESTRIAAAGARDLGQELVASTKGGVEQATTAVKSLTEAKSPTEFFQLQSELVKASFDRMVAEGSKITEHMVKLAGEAVQPLSSRASVNAEKFTELAA